MKKPMNLVTDHAVIRYLERVKGVDVDAIRTEIGHKAEAAIKLGACSVLSDGFRYKIAENGSVVTVTPAHEPAPHIGSYQRKREIK